MPVAWLVEVSEEHRRGTPVLERHRKGAVHGRMQVFLRSPGEDHLPLVYAASWWSADHVDEFLQEKQQPIWASLSQGHIELFREIQQVHYGNSEFLEE